MKHAALFIFAILIAVLSICLVAGEDIYTEAWVLCQPDSWVNVRVFAKKDAEVAGQLYSGDSIFLDGKSKRGFLHCSVAVEGGEGWVAKGYIVYSKPIEDGHTYRIKSNGRVAARRTVNGDRRRWLHNGDVLTVYMISDEWCLTSQGFIKTGCIDLTQRLDIENLDANDMTWEDDSYAGI